MTHPTPSAPETAEPASALIGRLTELLGKATPRPWFCGPLQAEDEYGAPGGVEIGPYDLAERYGTRSDYTPENLNSYYESNIATVSGQNQDPEAVAALIVAAVNELPVLLSLLTAQAAEIAQLSERVERAKAVIGPFAAMAEALKDWPGDESIDAPFVRSVRTERDPKTSARSTVYVRLELPDFRAAADFLGETK